MKSLREIVESSPRMRSVAAQGLRREEEPQPLGPARWDWGRVRSVLIVRLRSIGDTVLTTPPLFALRRFLPEARLDILLEDWVAPLLENFSLVDNVIVLKRRSTTARLRLAREIRETQYDVVYNLHGGTTATLLTRASGAPYRVGFAHYQYGRLHNHLAPSSLALWGTEKAHSVEQQLALLGWTGIPVSDRPPTQLGFSEATAARVSAKLSAAGIDSLTPFALVHPAAAFATKQWAVEKFGKVAEYLAGRGITTVALAAPHEAGMIEGLLANTSVPIVGFADLTLPEVTALSARARVFVGNDSGIAHIAAAVQTPAVVIFGSSNLAHWKPWAAAPAEAVQEEMECQPCHGYFCEKFAQPECILRVPVARVISAIERVLRESAF